MWRQGANRTVQSSLPFSVRILCHEPYRSKKCAVFRLFTKSADRTVSKNVHFSVFTFNKTLNGPYLTTVRFARLVFATVRFAVKKSNEKRCLRFCNGTVHVWEPKDGNNKHNKLTLLKVEIELLEKNKKRMLIVKLKKQNNGSVRYGTERYGHGYKFGRTTCFFWLKKL